MLFMKIMYNSFDEDYVESDDEDYVESDDEDFVESDDEDYVKQMMMKTMKIM